MNDASEANVPEIVKGQKIPLSDLKACRDAHSYRLGTRFAIFGCVNVVDFLITYLAIGSAFAMRAFFINRRYPPVWVAAAVIVELFLWLPLFVDRLVRRVVPSMRVGSLAEDDPDADLAGPIIDALRSVPNGRSKNELREILERYAALRFAGVDPSFRPDGEFELFAVAGHLNARTGTATLARKNAAKIASHKQRAVDDLLSLVASDAFSESSRLRSDMAEFFDLAGDAPSALKFRRSMVASSTQSRSIAASVGVTS